MVAVVALSRPHLPERSPASHGAPGTHVLDAHVGLKWPPVAAQSSVPGGTGATCTCHLKPAPVGSSPGTDDLMLTLIAVPRNSLGWKSSIEPVGPSGVEKAAFA